MRVKSKHKFSSETYYFGCCPECEVPRGGSRENIWFRCDLHRIKWSAEIDRLGRADRADL